QEDEPLLVHPAEVPAQRPALLPGFLRVRVEPGRDEDDHDSLPKVQAVKLIHVARSAKGRSWSFSRRNSFTQQGWPKAEVGCSAEETHSRSKVGQRQKLVIRRSAKGRSWSFEGRPKAEVGHSKKFGRSSGLRT